MPASQKFLQFDDREWYSLRSLIGNDWAIFYYMLGGREAGKSYATTKFFCSQWRKYGRPFYWIRLTETSKNKLLQNNAEKLVDPDIRRAFNLTLETSGDNVYEVIVDPKTKVKTKKLMCRVLALSTYYNDKGSGLFDKDFLNDPNMYYNICLDEMNREKNERKTFDILYAFTNQLENLVRSTKVRLRVIMIGNTLEEASDLMTGINFIPDDFGRYYLVKNKKKLKKYMAERQAATSPAEIKKIDEKYKKIDFGKRAVIDYIPLNEAYKTRRKGTIADIMMPEASTFTNEIQTDISNIYKGKLHKPTRIIKFGKEKEFWFTVWDSFILAPYNGEKLNEEYIVYMLPYEGATYDRRKVENIYGTYFVGGFRFKNLITQKKFKKSLELLKPKG